MRVMAFVCAVFCGVGVTSGLVSLILGDAGMGLIMFVLAGVNGTSAFRLMAGGPT